MNRRTFVAGLLLPRLLGAKPAFDYSRISVLTDEVAKTPEDAIAFTKQYGLHWVELRAVPGKRESYWSLAEGPLRETAKQLADNGLKVSFLNTGLLKFQLPGTEAARARTETPESRAKRLAADAARFENRIDDLRTAIRAAHILGVGKIRVFAFLRTPDPVSVFPRVAGILNEMAREAEKEGVHLLLENEASCNVATCVEAAAMLKLLSESVGLNWDPDNGLSFQETPYPNGYALLPKSRLANVQIKARSILPEYHRLIDWPGIFDALAADGYQGKVGLETHIFDGTLIQAAHKSLAEIRRILRVS